ncbi:MAG: hypothetical protein KDC35_07900 [Acidobacteria bacterium]|nr:hypothetical protein [Acidobacteriota bacterium]
MGNPWATIEFAVENVPDHATILVAAGLYSGRIRLDEHFVNGIAIQSDPPYLALLRHTSTVLTCFDGSGITLEGFDIAHTSSGAGPLVMQVQGANTERLIIRNNIFHDSYNNDLLKINNGCRDVLVEGNVFYNQSGSDEHIDINGVVNVEVRDNIFFNDFVGSGRVNNNNTSSYIVIKNSGGLPQNEQFHVHRNIFLNWEGSSGSNFLLFGEDGHGFYEARDALVENNLFIGNSSNNMRACFGVKGCREITFRNNTVVGDLPSLAFAMRLNREGSNLINEEIYFYNNIWSDPTGTMGAEFGTSNNDFSDTPPADTNTFAIDNNLYWNNGSAIPFQAGELVNYTDDSNRIEGNPMLPIHAGIVLPRWDPLAMQFLSGNLSIRSEFERLAQLAAIAAGSFAIDVANPTQSPVDDILGENRGPSPDIGAFESNPCMLIGDLDSDSDVDFDDLLLLLPNWRQSTYDLDGDGTVTILDGALLIQSFGSCP